MVIVFVTALVSVLVSTAVSFRIFSMTMSCSWLCDASGLWFYFVRFSNDNPVWYVLTENFQVIVKVALLRIVSG
jgi:hypothetical protein